jgi:hypothetical protein
MRTSINQIYLSGNSNEKKMGILKAGVSKHGKIV